ncbi:MAG: hypothetical protein PHC78_09065 [Verrucomicrobiota bacterium]|nr:hypothetical protein [Verrucomicrobiota bacterium]
MEFGDTLAGQVLSMFKLKGRPWKLSHQEGGWFALLESGFDQECQVRTEMNFLTGDKFEGLVLRDWLACD